MFVPAFLSVVLLSPTAHRDIDEKCTSLDDNAHTGDETLGLRDLTLGDSTASYRKEHSKNSNPSSKDTSGLRGSEKQSTGELAKAPRKPNPQLFNVPRVESTAPMWDGKGEIWDHETPPVGSREHLRPANIPSEYRK
ncbi:hypothetical protein B0H13DRAFT_2023923 [Mycena leptocephala]|nr:hypothetical protein B0H13DRAFT_2023923 [Mycena leptocephala]